MQMKQHQKVACVANVKNEIALPKIGCDSNCILLQFLKNHVKLKCDQPCTSRLNFFKYVNLVFFYTSITRCCNFVIFDEFLTFSKLL